MRYSSSATQIFQFSKLRAVQCIALLLMTSVTSRLASKRAAYGEKIVKTLLSPVAKRIYDLKWVCISDYETIVKICTGYSLSDQHILSPINPKIWRLILSDLCMKTYRNCSEIQNLQNLCFEFQNNLYKSCVYLTKSVVIFWVNW